MENQTLREQIFEVLFNYVREYDGIYTESDCATVRDEIMLALDQSQFTADEAEEHINQEVEKRIKERMPRVRWNYCPSCGADWEGDSDDFGCWVCGKTRSRLTPQVAPQVPLKTEGGGE